MNSCHHHYRACVKPVDLDTMKWSISLNLKSFHQPLQNSLMKALPLRVRITYGRYCGLPVVMLYIGEEFMLESKDPLSIQAVRLSRWLQASYTAEKWSVFPDRVLAAESASKLLQGLLERTRHTEAFLRDEMCPEIADMR